VHGSTGTQEVAFNITFLEPDVAMCPSLFHPKLLSSLNLYFIFIKYIRDFKFKLLQQLFSDALSMQISSSVDMDFLFI
jgi:hypothetical protein